MTDPQTDDNPPLELLTGERLMALGDLLRSPDLQPVGSMARQRRGARTLARMIIAWEADNPAAAGEADAG